MLKKEVKRGICLLFMHKHQPTNDCPSDLFLKVICEMHTQNNYECIVSNDMKGPKIFRLKSVVVNTPFVHSRGLGLKPGSGMVCLI